jgi:O-antigen ligase
MNHKISIIASVLLSIDILLEGLGITDGHRLALSIAYQIPLLLFILTQQKKTDFQAPKTLFYLAISLFVVSAVSTIMAVNKQNAIESVLYMISVSIIFLTYYNNRYDGKTLPKFLFAIAIILTVLAGFLFIQISMHKNVFIPDRAFQFIYAYYPSHHPIGALAIIPLGLLLPWLLEKKRNWYTIALFFIFVIVMIFSYYRSSYLAFLIMAYVSAITYASSSSKKKIVIFSILSTIILGIFIATISFDISKNIPVLSKTYNFLYTHTNLTYKSFSSNRIDALKQSIAGTLDRPFFGFGPGNFRYASEKFAEKRILVADTGENVILESFVETGVIGGSISILMLVLAVRFALQALKTGSLKEKQYATVFIGITALFLMGSYQLFYGYFLIFVVIGALFYREKENIRVPYPIIISVCSVLFIVGILHFTATLLRSQGTIALSHAFFPLQRENYPTLIQKEESTEKKERLINQYELLFPADTFTLEFIGNYWYEEKNGPEKALAYYIKSYEAKPLRNFDLIKRIYTITEELEGKQRADEWFAYYLEKYLETDEGKENITNTNEFILSLCKEKNIECVMDGRKYTELWKK